MKTTKHPACTRFFDDEAAIGNPAQDITGASNNINVGIGSYPELADHRLQELVVLPGALLVHAAQSAHFQIFGSSRMAINNIQFGTPVILSDEDVSIRARTTSGDGDCINYRFDAMASARQRPGLDGHTCATLEIPCKSPEGANPVANEISVGDFKENAEQITAEELYGRFWKNGNQYGPAFRNLFGIWKTADEAIAEVKIRHDLQTVFCDSLTVLLDSTVQLLGALAIDRGETFILKSIKTIELADIKGRNTLWVHAARRRETQEDENGFIGDVHVFDESGTTFLRLEGVVLALLDALDVITPPHATEKINIRVASTFTADPLEDSLQFWRRHFGISLDLQFTPYNQVFQQLLDPKSAFHRNRDGINVILLNLSDWMDRGRRIPVESNGDRELKALSKHSRYVLPNGLEIAHLNRYETDYLYEEIFEDESYLRNGIELHDGDTVVDVGANIGLFSLFVKNYCKNPIIYSFEPSPVAFDILKANCDAYGGNIHAFNLGVSDRSQTGHFTFYEHSSVFSGFYADENDDKEAVQAVVRNTLTREIPGDSDLVDGYVDDLMRDRLKATTYECQVVSLSDVIREHKIDKIDLLKIDAEKSELDVINGIELPHWQIIQQIVVEVHDKTERAVQLVRDTLLNKGYRCTVVKQTLLEESGLFSIYATRREPASESESARKTEQLKKQIDDFCTAVRFLKHASATRLFVAVAPSRSTAEIETTMTNAERQLESALAGISDVQFMSSAAISRNYPVANWHDFHRQQLGHIPYTQEGYTAVGTALFRSIFNLTVPPFKVIVLDCDNTLWKGICGEDGSSGIEITDPFRFLQEFIVQQRDRGMLICLCSKNNERDVCDVFAQRTDMVLQWQHLTAWRVNWCPKSENLRSLASQLQLGLDSFIFIDDNAVECAEVRMNCQDAIVLQLPQDSERIPAFLRNAWVFDSMAKTAEDSERVRWYQANSQREQLQAGSISLKDFLKNLELSVAIAEAREAELSRVSQLTFRTNQFNFTGRRRSESQIRDLLRNSNVRCAVAKVTDRFGDYGLVGVMLYELKSNCYEMDTFLLSCRALGKGIEHRMLLELARFAEQDGKNSIRICLIPTGRNRPAFDFINGIAEAYKDCASDGIVFNIPTAKLTSLSYDPDQMVVAGQSSAEKRNPKPREHHSSDLSMKLQMIANELYDVPRIVQQIDAYRGLGGGLKTTDVAATTALESALTAIWKRVLRRTEIGLNQNFFDAGGTSLKAVQVVVLVRRELNRNLSITNLFQYPTIKLLAQSLDSSGRGREPADEAVEVKARGRLRRERITKRGNS